MHTHAYFGWTSDFRRLLTCSRCLLSRNGVNGHSRYGQRSRRRAQSAIRGFAAASARRSLAMVISWADARRTQKSRSRRRSRSATARTTDGKPSTCSRPKASTSSRFNRACRARRLLRESRPKAKKVGKSSSRDTCLTRSAPVGGHHGPASGTFRASHRIFEASTPDEDALLKRRLRRGEGSVDQQRDSRPFSNHYDAGARGEYHRRSRQEHGVAVPHALFGSEGQWLVDVIDWKADPDNRLTFPRTWIDKKYPSDAKEASSRSMDNRRAFRRSGGDSLITNWTSSRQIARGENVPFLAGTDTPGGASMSTPWHQSAPRAPSDSSRPASRRSRRSKTGDHQPRARFPREDVRSTESVEAGARCGPRDLALESAREHCEYSNESPASLPMGGIGRRLRVDSPPRAT